MAETKKYFSFLEMAILKKNFNRGGGALFFQYLMPRTGLYYENPGGIEILMIVNGQESKLKRNCD